MTNHRLLPPPAAAHLIGLSLFWLIDVLHLRSTDLYRAAVSRGTF